MEFEADPYAEQDETKLNGGAEKLMIVFQPQNKSFKDIRFRRKVDFLFTEIGGNFFNPGCRFFRKSVYPVVFNLKYNRRGIRKLIYFHSLSRIACGLNYKNRISDQFILI